MSCALVSCFPSQLNPGENREIGFRIRTLILPSPSLPKVCFASPSPGPASHSACPLFPSPSRAAARPSRASPSFPRPPSLSGHSLGPPPFLLPLRRARTPRAGEIPPALSLPRPFLFLSHFVSTAAPSHAPPLSAAGPTSAAAVTRGPLCTAAPAPRQAPALLPAPPLARARAASGESALSAPLPACPCPFWQGGRTPFSLSLFLFPDRRRRHPAAAVRLLARASPLTDLAPQPPLRPTTFAPLLNPCSPPSRPRPTAVEHPPSAVRHRPAEPSRCSCRSPSPLRTPEGDSGRLLPLSLSPEPCRTARASSSPRSPASPSPSAVTRPFPPSPFFSPRLRELGSTVDLPPGAAVVAALSSAPSPRHHCRHRLTPSPAAVAPSRSDPSRWLASPLSPLRSGVTPFAGLAPRRPEPLRRCPPASVAAMSAPHERRRPLSLRAPNPCGPRR